jgi:outer membrane protein assembly factor BamB
LAPPSQLPPTSDWPQWRGPNRDDVSKETGLLKEWPAGGPKKVWSFEKAGNGYAGVSTAAGKLFTMGIREGKEVLFALDTETGKEVWASPMGNAFQGDKPSYKTGWGEGPRGTPTVDADRVYALGPGEVSSACPRRTARLCGKRR